MISFGEALALVLERSRPLGAVSASLTEMHGCVLAEPLVAAFDIPRCDNSSVDGYAIHAADSPGTLTVTGSQAAGEDNSFDPMPGVAVRIFTGARVPEGFDSVVMQEEAASHDGCIDISSGVSPGENVRVAGSEARAGQTLVAGGAVATPPVVALAASLGLEAVPFYREPHVKILVTGKELASPGESKLTSAQIYDANGPGLRAACHSAGCPAQTLAPVRDEIDELKPALQAALGACDVLITSGGVSVGEHDLVRSTLLDLGCQEVFWRVAMAPGKPVLFMTRGDQLIFGLPGNPVSSLVTFFLLVRPALCAMRGLNPSSLNQKVILESELEKSDSRMHFVRGNYLGDRVAPGQSQGSAMLTGLANANCLIHHPAETNRLEAGSRVTITPLDWNGVEAR